MSIDNLFSGSIQVVNLGLSSFLDALKESNTPHVQVDWKPGLDVDPSLISKFDKNRDIVDKANKEATDIIASGSPFLTGMAQAFEVIPGMHKKLILHAGPPITWDRMCGPMKGAIIGALIYENLASNPEEAEKLASSGEIEYSPCHEHNSVGPMAGIISYSMPVFIVKNKTFGNETYCTQNEGLGKVLRYGAFSEEVVNRLRWMETTLYPTLKKAVEFLGEIDLKALISQALHMGDEVHNRNRAGTSLFYRVIAPAIVRTSENREDAAKALEFIHGNDHFFLNLSMPASKAILDAARGIKNSSIVVVMARNGTDFGIQIAGDSKKWYTGKALVPDALFFPGFTKNDANPDIGDSAITETAGLGGFAIAASPAIVQFVGGNASDALNYTMEMYEITASESRYFQIPSLNFRGTPTAIDIRKVVEKNITPFIDTGVAHKEPGVGQVGAGVLRAPSEPFQKGYVGFASLLDE
ncbi:DUF1116 domain-containing protein [bacterium]|nr:DUF1116 domain-containing protein [bacterium]